MVDQALVGAEQLLLAPAFTDAAFFSLLRRNAKLRALVKFERWDDVLALEWDEESEVDQLFTVYARFRAHLGLGDLAAARELHKDTKKQGAGAPEPPGRGPGPDGDDEAFLVSMMKRELGERMPEFEALLLLAEGEYLDGLARLAAAAESQVETWENDPPREPVYLYNLLGDEYLKIGAARLAAQCYERTLETVMNDGFAYAGMVVAYSQLGELDKAEDAMAKLQVIWSDADRPNRWLAAAEATGVTADPRLESPVAERNYKTEVLDRIGPSLWVPGSAPALTATNAAGEKVSLEDYRGQSVLAIFYLGDECVHCIEQIMMAEERLEAIGELGAVVLAISKDSVEEIAVQSESLGVTLLSDTDFVSARRFNSYDDFEEIELHSTFLIDPLGRVHWSRIGGDPFTDFDFLESELARLQRQHETADSDEDGTLEAGSRSGQVPVPDGLRR